MDFCLDSLYTQPKTARLSIQREARTGGEMHLSPTVWLIIGCATLICLPAALELFFGINVNDITEKPLVRDIIGLFWLYMACLALRDVIASKGLSVDALFGFAFCIGCVIYGFWP